MDIASAFTTEAIEQTDTNVGGDEEDVLREVIREIYTSNQLELTRDHENVAVLCFVAGRCHQANQEFTVNMSPLLAGEFMEFLAKRGAT